jgi:hypothetical protein
MLPIGCGIEWYIELNPAAAEWNGSLADAACIAAEVVTAGADNAEGVEEGGRPGVDGESAPPPPPPESVVVPAGWADDAGWTPWSPLSVVVPPPPPPPLTPLSTDGGPPLPGSRFWLRSFSSRRHLARRFENQT